MKWSWVIIVVLLSWVCIERGMLLLPGAWYGSQAPTPLDNWGHLWQLLCLLLFHSQLFIDISKSAVPWLRTFNPQTSPSYRWGGFQERDWVTKGLPPRMLNGIPGNHSVHLFLFFSLLFLNIFNQHDLRTSILSLCRNGSHLLSPSVCLYNTATLQAFAVLGKNMLHYLHGLPVL